MAVPTVISHTHSDAVVIEVHGDVGEAAGDQLRRELITAMMRRRPRRIVVDLSHADSLDPGAVGALIAANDAANDLRLTLALHGPSDDIAAELTAHGLTPIRAAA
jgi:anti-anti-sigma factor